MGVCGYQKNKDYREENNMNKKELVGAIVDKTGFTKKDSEVALKAIVESIEEELVKGGSVKLIGFGSFGTSQRKARIGRNPRKPEQSIKIPASKAVVFKAGRGLKEKVNG